MVRRRSTVRFRKGAPGGLHVSVGPIFTYGSDIWVFWWRVVWCAGWAGAVAGLVPGLSRVRAWFAWLWLLCWWGRARGFWWLRWWVRAVLRRGGCWLLGAGAWVLCVGRLRGGGGGVR